MKEWFEQLEERERRLVILMALVVGLGFFYWGLWQPLHQGVASSETRLNSQYRQLLQMQQNAQRVAQAKPQSGGKQVQGSLSQQISQLARQNQITLSRLQPQGDDVTVRIDSIAFNELLPWLQILEQQGMAIIGLDLAETSDSGMVVVRRLHLGVKA